MLLEYWGYIALSYVPKYVYFSDLGVHKISTPLIPLKELPKGLGSAHLLTKSLSFQEFA